MILGIVIGSMIVGGCTGGLFGSYEDRGSDFPGFGFMIFGLLGAFIGAIVGAVLAEALT